jgi:maltose O-acetyltransferase
MRGDLTPAQLRKSGVRIGGYLALEAGVWIDREFGWLIEFGPNVILAPRVMVFAHDGSTRTGLGYTRLAPVYIGENVYIGAGSIVLPGVTIGAHAIIGAGSIVSRDVPPGSLAAGSPARVLGSAEEYLDRRRLELAEGERATGGSGSGADATGPDWRSVVDASIRATGAGWVR